MSFSLKPEFETAPVVKALINIGALMDIPTGYYMTGVHGESVLNGGLGQLTGVVGIGNSFKSTILHYMSLSAMDKITASVETSLGTYDTEVNTHIERLLALAKRFPFIGNMDLINTGLWNITDKTMYYANEWYEMLKKFLKGKKDNASKILVETPFLDKDGKTLMKILTPTFSEIDSFSAFQTEDVAKIQEETELGDSSGNTIYMRQGLAKNRFLMEMPKESMSANHYVLMTAHVGKEIQMASGPVPQPPARKLLQLKNGDKIKGVTDQFFFLMSNCWQTVTAAPLMNQGTKTVEYPKNSDDNVVGDNDLHIVTMRQLRGKSGPSGAVIEIIVSQIEGVLPELTEFHYIKGSDRFGISGSLQHYSLDLLPDVKLSRTTVRGKIDENPRLRRALNITAEMCQMKQYHKYDILMCTPKELYDDLIKLGYDWNVLLETRGWWTVNNDKHPIKFLSTLDLLKMRAELYRPYWMDKK